MKRITQLSLSGIALLSTVLPAFAATGAREDNSMTLVYLFLGVCGLIIFLQLIPFFALGFGIIKGIISHKEQKEGLSRLIKSHELKMASNPRTKVRI
jgi:predicted membrane channel-forming protein YqfA (hemolysin III family)